VEKKKKPPAISTGEGNGRSATLSPGRLRKKKGRRKGAIPTAKKAGPPVRKEKEYL